MIVQRPVWNNAEKNVDIVNFDYNEVTNTYTRIITDEPIKATTLNWSHWVQKSSDEGKNDVGNDNNKNEDMNKVQFINKFNGGIIQENRKKSKDKQPIDKSNISALQGSMVNQVMTDYDKLIHNKFSINEIKLKLKNKSIDRYLLENYISSADDFYTSSSPHAKSYIYYTLVLKELYEQDMTPWNLEYIHEMKGYDRWDYFQSLCYTNIDYKNQDSYKLRQNARTSKFEQEMNHLKLVRKRNEEGGPVEGNDDLSSNVEQVYDPWTNKQQNRYYYKPGKVSITSNSIFGTVQINSDNTLYDNLKEESTEQENKNDGIIAKLRKTATAPKGKKPNTFKPNPYPFGSTAYLKYELGLDKYDKYDKSQQDNKPVQVVTNHSTKWLSDLEEGTTSLDMEDSYTLRQMYVQEKEGNNAMEYVNKHREEYHSPFSDTTINISTSKEGMDLITNSLGALAHEHAIDSIKQDQTPLDRLYNKRPNRRR